MKGKYSVRTIIAGGGVLATFFGFSKFHLEVTSLTATFPAQGQAPLQIYTAQTETFHVPSEGP
jgi:hypothetical protein